MESANPWRMLGAVEFVEAAARCRAESYRERAAQLSIMAAAEPIGSLRTELLELAARYAGLAENLQIPGD